MSDHPQPVEPELGVETSESPLADPTPWLRLDLKVVWVDLLRLVLSLVPYFVAVWVFRVEQGSGALWPVIGVAVFGVLGSVGDVVRWAFTRYRITPEFVERRTGVFVRQYRTLRRDRVRSVDSSAKLLQRFAGLRVVEVGAGQQMTAGESALALDAVSKVEADRLRKELLGSSSFPAATSAGEADALLGEEILARMRPWWFVYNMFSFWSFVMAAGLIWGAYWLGSTFGIDLNGWVMDRYDWESLSVPWRVAIGVAAVGLVGAVAMAFNYFTEYWNFELARVRGAGGSQLRTRRGLFRTQEVSRDDKRMRGIHISEPVLWRWMKATDTNVITTGLNVWSIQQPTSILPRAPGSEARRVAAVALGVDPSPFEAELAGHPTVALRRRIAWAVGASGLLALLGWWLAATDALPSWTRWIGLILLPFGLLGAWISYRALGHAVVGDYLVFRSGLVSRGTVALRRDAVSTIAISQSLLQRRLRLKTVYAMSAAGWGTYGAVDVAAADAVGLADRVAPGVLSEFLVAPGSSLR